MLSYTGLSEKACEALANDHHIYLLKSGRISLAGLNKGKVRGRCREPGPLLIETLSARYR